MNILILCLIIYGVLQLLGILFNCSVKEVVVVIFNWLMEQ